MIIKALNSYRVIHKNGAIEDINADSIMTALNNLTISEEESVVLNVSLVKEDVRTLVEEPEPEPVPPEDDNLEEENPEDPEVNGELDLDGSE